MKILKIIGILIAAIVLIIVVLAYTTPTSMEYEKSVNIDASTEVVWENVNSIGDLNTWSPWLSKDPYMKQETTGESGAIGEMHSWESDSADVGSGSQTISKLEAPNLVEMDLKFTGDYESEAKAYVKLDSDGGSTKATWGFSSEMPRPMNLMLLMMSTEDMIGEDYAAGLANLKALSEEDQAELEKQILMEAMAQDTVEIGE